MKIFKTKEKWINFLKDYSVVEEKKQDHRVERTFKVSEKEFVRFIVYSDDSLEFAAFIGFPASDGGFTLHNEEDYAYIVLNSDNNRLTKWCYLNSKSLSLSELKKTPSYKNMINKKNIIKKIQKL